MTARRWIRRANLAPVGLGGVYFTSAREDRSAVDLLGQATRGRADVKRLRIGGGRGDKGFSRRACSKKSSLFQKTFALLTLRGGRADVF